MRTSVILALALLTISQLGYASGHRYTSLEQAVSEARAEYPGQVISARTQRFDGHETHNIRILTRDGQVRRLRFDADSGRLLRGRR